MFENTHDTPEKAQRIFDRLCDLFKEQGINPSPLNYYIYYEYIKGGNPKFRQEMDAILNDEYGYNDRAGKRLYDEYLKDDDSPASEFDRAFRRLIDVMVKKMNTWSERLDTHTKELDRCSNELNNPDIDAQTVKAITQSVLNAAQTMKQSTQAFQQDFVSSSTEVKELREQLLQAQCEAMKDELTQVGNRKMFNERLADLMLENQDKPNKLCLILADLDHFKKFNDNYGHLVGDSILRFFSNIMKKLTKSNHTICRYGGEEFAIILNSTTLDEAEKKAEEIRVALENTHLKRKDQNKPISTVTASFGVATYQDNENAETFIARADKALYKAKDNGRNQVVTQAVLGSET